MNQDFVTKKHFDETLDNFSVKFKQVDKRFNDKFDYLDEKIDTVLEAVYYGFKKNSEEHTRFLEKITKSQNQLDRYIKSREDSNQEFTILKESVRIVEKKVGIDR